MKFNYLVAVIATLCVATQANARSGGTLRQPVAVAQNDDSVMESQPTQGVVIMNTNTNSNSNSAAATAQPVTVVEASPVAESKAELMRKARQGEEVKTEQKIVEKLEESRLKEEQQRAERLFGDRLETPAAAASATAIVTPSAAAATATAVVVEQKKEEPKKEEAVRPTQVTIEKVEIIQPREEAPEKAPVIISEQPEAASSMKVEDTKEDEVAGKFYVGGLIGAPNYDASNVESHFGLGVLVGMNIDSNWVIEASFLYSNHSVDTYWLNPLYKDLDQFDFSLGAKYYLFTGKLRPYGGASITYIYRKYQDRSLYGDYYNVNPSATEEDSNAVNVGLTAGVDFAISKKFTIGGGFDYNFNVMNRQDFRSQYGLPSGIKPLEEIDYTMIKITGKMTF